MDTSIPAGTRFSGYRADTGIIFIQWGGDGYHTIRTHGYPLKLPLLDTNSSFFDSNCLASTNLHPSSRLVGLQGFPTLSNAKSRSCRTPHVEDEDFDS